MVRLKDLAITIEVFTMLAISLSHPDSPLRQLENAPDDRVAFLTLPLFAFTTPGGLPLSKSSGAEER